MKHLRSCGFKLLLEDMQLCHIENHLLRNQDDCVSVYVRFAFCQFSWKKSP